MAGKPLTREYLHVLCMNEACDGYPPDQYNDHKPWPAECAESHAAINAVFDRLEECEARLKKAVDTPPESA